MSQADRRWWRLAGIAQRQPGRVCTFDLLHPLLCSPAPYRTRTAVGLIDIASTITGTACAFARIVTAKDLEMLYLMSAWPRSRA